MTSTALDRSYADAERVTASWARSFYFASRFVPLVPSDFHTFDIISILIPSSPPGASLPAPGVCVSPSHVQHQPHAHLAQQPGSSQPASEGGAQLGERAQGGHSAPSSVSNAMKRISAAQTLGSR